MKIRFGLWDRARFAPAGEGGDATTTTADTKTATTTGTATTGADTKATAAATTGADTKATTAATTADPETAWMSDLPEELQKDPTLARYKAKDGKHALGVLASSLLTTKRMVSEGALPLPKTDEDRARIFDALGRPKTAGDYSYKPDLEKLKAAGLNYDEKAGQAFNAFAHGIGLSDAQHSASVDYYWQGIAGFAKGMLDQRDQEFADGEKALKAEWQGPAYEQNTKIARAAHAKFGGPEWLAFLDETGLGNHPMMQKFAHAAGIATLSDEELKGATEATGGMTEQQIDAELAAIKKNPAFTTKGHPEHDVVMTRHRQLMAWKHPDPQR